MVYFKLLNKKRKICYYTFRYKVRKIENLVQYIYN